MAEIKRLKTKRSQIKSQLTRFKTYFVNLGDAPDLIQLEDRFFKIQHLLDEFNDIQSQIECALASEETLENFDVEQSQERETFENLFYDTTSSVKKYLIIKKPQVTLEASTSAINPSQLINNQTVANVKLPTLNLPTFNGQYDRWLEFSDAFNSLIHTNNTISDVQKFYYLRSSLRDEAAIVIRAVEVSAANYHIAWQLLRERFENKRIIIHNHLKGLFELPCLVKESPILLRQLLDNVLRHLRSLQALGQETQYWDTLIIYLITSKLDSITRREWESSKFANDLPTMAEITTFLRTKCEILETLQVNKGNPIKVEHFNSKPQKRQEIIHPSSNAYFTTTNTCVFCNGDHSIYNCTEFATLPVNSRSLEIKKLHLCINCLRKGHLIRDCRSTYNCRKCNRKHNTLLHIDHEPAGNTSLKEVNNQQVAGSSNPQEILLSSTTIANHALNFSSSQILLSTALIEVRDFHGKIRESRVLLDSGSQSNFITDEMCQLLGLQKQRINSTVSSISQAITNISYKTEIKLQSRHNAFKATITCLILPNITANLPPISFDSSSLDLPQNIKLADPGFNQTGKIDMLLGASIFWELMCIGQIHLGKNQPVLQKTQFGWVIGGSISIPQDQKIASVTYCSINANQTVESQLEKFWEIEEVQAVSKLSEEEQACENKFVATTKRTGTGRFEVNIPLRDNKSQLGESRNMALKRLFSIERKLGREPKLKEEYTKFMADYENLGHMSRIKENQSETQLSYYLPHHAVIKNSSTTTKVRVVFDGSAKTSSNLSLNDIQMVGPTIQNDLFSILIRFRKHAFVITADIEKMYRQILVKPEQRRLQRILWRSDVSQSVQCYELNTVTYGTASAPFLAIRCLYQLGIDNENLFPRESCIIKNDFYVDDLLTGANSIKELIDIKNNIKAILEPAGFNLRKWVSNESRVLNDRYFNSSVETELIQICKELETKTLGILWNPTADTLQYAVKNLREKHVTKRTILSETAQIYDPLGLIGPITITAKIIIQKLWQYKLSWDESIPLDLYSRWSKFRNELQLLNQIKIPRNVLAKAPVLIELHGFCDSSESAYGACLYIRSINESNETSVQLLCAKSKVAPLRNVTLPRLELCGALLLAKLTEKILAAIQIQFHKFYFWCDSTIVLSWIRRPANHWKTFVANRVATIQNITKNVNDWRHIRTYDNPADLISRGVTPNQLLKSKLWWQGPAWLIKDIADWPPVEEYAEGNDELSELRNTATATLLVTSTNFNLFSKYSSFIRLQRIVAYCLRFKTNAQNRKITGPLTVTELQNATFVLVKIAQAECFKQELKDLKNLKSVPKSSNLVKLNPFLDEQGIIRVGGRLTKSNFTYEKRHPIVLPIKHTLSELITRYEHLRLLHCGPQALLSSLRDRYWPLAGRNLARKVVYNCVQCFKTNPKNTEQIMGALPATRLSPSPPFFNCGVDYAGPFYIKDKKSRGCKTIKCYICLFVCFATKAVHLELVGNLTTEMFLAALKRFISRRGKPLNIYSDNGSTFVGANSELKELSKFLNSKDTQSEIRVSLNSESISWHFIPPRSPHFGGLWEAGVKSTKSHLKRVIGNASLVYEEFNSILIQVEAVLNSRPLSPLSSDPNDLNPITPAHFLIGRALTAIPEPSYLELNENRLSRFQRLQKLTQHFWTRWSKEYVSELQERTKWKISHPNLLKIGTMVIIREDNLPPLKWKLGRVMELHPGHDGVPRVLTIRTANRCIKRAVSKVCVLPIE